MLNRVSRRAGDSPCEVGVEISLSFQLGHERLYGLNIVPGASQNSDSLEKKSLLFSFALHYSLRLESRKHEQTRDPSTILQLYSA